MNPVSLIMRSPTPGMIGRIANARGPDRTAKRSMLFARSAIGLGPFLGLCLGIFLGLCLGLCLGLAFSTPSFAQRKELATCEKEWRDNKVFNQAAGITKRDWVAKCRADSAKKRADAAAPLSVPLKKSQVNAVCGGIDWCQKACGLNGQDTCSLGCGLEGCSGQCMNCSSRRVSARTIQTVVAHTKRPWQ